ncbi:MAG TPA: SGNH/GDSL hydrolase family protein [Spirochaetota bacterium]|nr:SGNH/GDSL hydrolase family protein [Spirochaetota bacterium]
MKRILCIVLLLAALSPVRLYAEEKILTIIGDSRATELGDGSSIKSATANGVTVLDQADVEGNIRNSSVPGSTSENWLSILPILAQNKSHATFISIGGNDVRDLYGFLEYYKHIHTVQQGLYFMWVVEVQTDFIASRTRRIVQTILNADPNNKVLLNDVAPVIDYKTKEWRWQFFYTANYMLSILGRKYQNMIVDSLQTQYGDRVQMLATYQEFLDNILNGGASYYDIGALTDFVHFGPQGVEAWGKMVAIRLGALGWYQLNGGMCSAEDTAPPVIRVPENGILQGWTVFPVDIPLAVDFQVRDDGQLLEVTGANLVEVNGNTRTYRIDLHSIQAVSGAGSYEKRITATDMCGKRTQYVFRYDNQLTGVLKVYYWLWWYQYTISYSFVPL